MLSEYFWAFFVTATAGFLLAMFRLCYKSKCQNVKLCGVEIKRDVIAEEKETELELRLSDSEQL